MNVTQVAALTRSYVDEPNTTYLTAAQMALYLESAYATFQNMVTTVIPDCYTETVDIVLNNVTQYDLADPASAVRIMGNPAGGLTNQRLLKIIQVAEMNPDLTFLRIWKGVPGTRSLAQVPSYTGEDRYWLVNTSLLFNRTVTGTLTIFYQPYSNIDWTKQGAAQTEFIDDFQGHHDLIALEAAKKFMVRVGVENPALLRELEERRQDFQQFLSSTRDRDAVDGVTVEW